MERNPEMAIEEAGHNTVRLLGFGQIGIVPKSVRQSLENHELSVHAGAQERTVQDRRST
jgi:hypothetical protein